SSGAGHGSADGDDTITVNGQVVDNRVITASAVNFGRVIAGANVTSNTTLSSPGSDDSNTRVTVLGTIGSADANGVLITSGVDNVFNGSLTTANRTLQGNFATAGAKSGSRSFPLQGEGLTGESVQPVSVSYSATALNHSNASFTTPADTNSQTIDFGYV